MRMVVEQQKWKVEPRCPWPLWFDRNKGIGTYEIKDVTFEDALPKSDSLDATFDESAERLMTPELRAGIVSLLNHLNSELEDRKDVTVEVLGVHDVEEGSDDITIFFSVNASPEIAMQLWDRLGKRMDSWLNSQNELLRSAVRDATFIEVHWN